jgi:peptidoglycan/xylan/chitin deacetylase (PgdA/CDA1 family)
MAAQRIPVLMYHRVGTAHHASEQKYCVSPERFAAHMNALARSGYQSVAIADFMDWLDGRRDLPEGSFVLTFDDGFQGVHDYAAPVLAERGWPATVFLVSALIGKQDEWMHHEAPDAATYPLLDAAHIHALTGQGFSFHSHSRHHADLTRVSDAELEDEVGGSRTELGERLGTVPDLLAYPYGRFDERVVDCAKRAGYRAAFSVLSGFNRPGCDPFRIRRQDIFGTDTPAMLLRKIRLGTNDGSWRSSLRYAAGRFKQRLGLPA